MLHVAFYFQLKVNQKVHVNTGGHISMETAIHLRHTIPGPELDFSVGKKVRNLQVFIQKRNNSLLKVLKWFIILCVCILPSL